MNPVIMAEESAWKILTGEDTEEETEEEIRHRRIMEREGMAFMSYMKAQKEKNEADEKSAEERKKAARLLMLDFYRRHLQKTLDSSGIILESLTRHDEIVSNFIFIEESPENMKKRDELLQKANIDKNEFCAIVVAGAGDNDESKSEIDKLFKSGNVSEKIREKIKNRLKYADDAVQDFGRGDIRKMENILKEGLAAACHSFVNASDALSAVHWSRQINCIMSVVGSHPVLFREGANTSLLTAATGMAAIGRIMENGMKALNELCAARLNGTELSEDAEQNLQSQILLMQQSDAQRSEEGYQKFFAKLYHPKKGLQSKSLDELLKKLGKSRAVCELMNMDKMTRDFALTDGKTRKTVSEGLFVPYEEKKSVAVTEAEKKASEPALSY